MQLENIAVELYNIEFASSLPIPPKDLDLEWTDYFNNVGEWTLKLPGNHFSIIGLEVDEVGLSTEGGWITPGLRIRVAERLEAGGYRALFSGPATKIEFASTPEDPGGTFTIEGVSDNAYLAWQVCYPDPADADAGTATVSHHVVTGAAETVMREYVDNNIGEDALAARQVWNLTNATDNTLGPTITKRARFHNLGQMCADIASLGGLGFRIIQDGFTTATDLLTYLRVYQPEDKSDEVKLNIFNNTLLGHREFRAVPGVTEVWIGGQGELELRQFDHWFTTQSEDDTYKWIGARIERFVDQRQTDDEQEFEDKATEILNEEGHEFVGLQILPREDYDTFGDNWWLGDLVSVALTGAGSATEEYITKVAGYTVKANSDGFMVGVLLGDPGEFGLGGGTSQDGGVQGRLQQLELADANISTMTLVEWYTASDTWNKPAGAKYHHVEAAGAGGGSGAAGATSSGQQSQSGGGGGGSTGEIWLQAADVGSTVTVTIGAGGTAGATDAGNGGTGGTTSFGTHLVCPGGAGGLGMAGTSGSGYSAPAAGGTGVSGDSGFLGWSGDYGGFARVSGGLSVGDNRGGANRYSSSRTGDLNASDAVVGRFAGGGARGALNGASSSARAGAAGNAGWVRVTTYF